MGARDTKYRNADNAVSGYECRAGCRRGVTRPHRMGQTWAHARNTCRNAGERRVLPYPSNYCSTASVAGSLYGYTPLRSILVVGIRGRLARWRIQAGDGGRVHGRHNHNADSRPGGEMAKQGLRETGRGGRIDRLMRPSCMGTDEFGTGSGSEPGCRRFRLL